MPIDFSVMEMIGAAVALLIAFVILLNAEKIGSALGVVDHPDNGRKMHARATPLIGGIAMMVPLILWSTVGFVIPAITQHGYVPLAGVVCGSAVAILGFLDDRHPISPFLRLFALLALTVLALLIDPRLLPSAFHWNAAVSTPVAPWLSCALVAIGMAGFVNAVNMADGQDGCVAGMFAIWSSCAILASGGVTAGLAGMILATSIVVLAFNLRGKVFLGGAGAYGVTFVFGLLILRLHNHWGVLAETIIIWLFIPIVDCLRLMIMRPLLGHSPFEGDRNHFHHRLQRRFGESVGLTIYLGTVALSSFTATLLPQSAPVVLLLLAGLYLCLMLLTGEAAARPVPVKITNRD
ncbi:MAG TPA: MraY family glycosyltransferase [Rhizomicrobium sp.]|nr:MraY family glycosyltransferase [Rhizomicrobium sp.]